VRRDKAECGKVQLRTENVAGRSWTPQPLAITPGAASRQNDNVLVGVYEKHPEGKGMPISFHSSEISSSPSFGAPPPLRSGIEGSGPLLQEHERNIRPFAGCSLVEGNGGIGAIQFITLAKYGLSKPRR